MVYPALLPLKRTPRLPVVDLTDAPADLNGLVRFAETQNLASARVPSHFNWPLLRKCQVLSLYDTSIKSNIMGILRNCSSYKTRVGDIKYNAD